MKGWARFRTFCFSLLLVLASCSVGIVVPDGAKAETVSSFVQVDGTEFTLNGSKFYFAGTNNYYFHYKSNKMIDDVLEDAKAMNLKVIRIWGFFDGASQEGKVMQPEPGVYDESGFERFDYATKKAKELGIKLVVPLVNNWDDFGGMNQYVKWFNASKHDDFYTHPQIKQAYKNFVYYFLNRTNTYTGVKYKDEPTIMTWELANEPRCQTDRTGNTLVAWADEMSTYIRSIDKNHLIAVGDEGFYTDGDPADWTSNGGEGVDWKRLIALPHISYGTFHLYPDHWSKTPEWGRLWIIDHIRDAHAAGKPVVLEEFGYKDQSVRNSVYQSWLDAVEEYGGNGSQFWILTGIQDDGSLYPDYDGFRITYPSATAEIIAQHAARMNEKSTPEQPPQDFAQLTPQNGATGISTQPTFSWEGSAGATSYSLVVSEAADYSNPAIQLSSLTGTSVKPTVKLKNETTYYWKVTATNALGSKVASNAGSSFTTEALAVPGEFTLTAKSGDGKVDLSWTASSQASSYDVLRSTSEDGPFTTVKSGVASTSYADTGLANGTTYYYQVIAKNTAGSKASNVVSATPAKPQANLVLQYRAADTSTGDNSIKPHFQIKNTGTTPIDLKEVKIRYWYTNDGGKEQAFFCDYAQVQCTNVKGSFGSVTLAKTGADTYLEVTFTGGTLAVDGQSGEIQTRVHHSDWSNYNEANDYSFDATKTVFTDWDRVTLYYRDALVWGSEPK